MIVYLKEYVYYSSDGMGRSGTFIGIHSQLQRMTAEGKIDLFQFIKAARAQRAGLLPYQVRYFSGSSSSSISLLQSFMVQTHKALAFDPFNTA